MFRSSYSLNAVVGTVIFLTVTVIIGLTGVWDYTQEKRNILEAIQQETEHTTATLRESVTNYVAAFAPHEYERLIANEMTSPNIVAIVVADKKLGQILGQETYDAGSVHLPGGGMESYDPSNPVHLDLVDTCFFRQVSDLTDSAGENIGRLTICASGDMLREARQRIMIEQSLQSVAVILLLTAILLFTIHRIVLRPVHRIAGGLAVTDKTGIPTAHVTTKGAQEIGGLGASINQMIDAVRASRNELEKKHTILSQREAQLTASEQKLKEIIWGTNAGTWEWNVRTGETAFNDRWAEIVGYRLSELAPVSIKTWETLTHPEDLEKSAQALERHFSGEAEFYECEVRMKHKDGHWVWVLDRGKVVERAVDGKPLRMSGTHIDITALKMAEQRIIDAIEAIPDGFVLWDKNDRLVMCNSTYRDIYAEIADRFVEGVSFEDVLRAGIEKGVFNTGGAPDEWTEKRLAEHREGQQSVKQTLTNGRTILVSEGFGVNGDQVGVRTDITDLERTLRQMEAYNEELRTFAYVASHDLREPLRMVTNYLQLLSRRYADALDQDAHDFIGFAVDGAVRMDSLIKDLLSYSRVETHGQAFVTVSADEVLHDTLDNLKAVIDERQARITAAPLPLVHADPQQLLQLLQNLISNAIKYCSDDRVPEIRVSAETVDHWVVFSIDDNGLGIPEDQFEHIFGMFQRLHGREEYSGTGIGLAVCKKIVERHGGRIWLTSVVGEGSTFKFTLPAP